MGHQYSFLHDHDPLRSCCNKLIHILSAWWLGLYNISTCLYFSRCNVIMLQILYAPLDKYMYQVYTTVWFSKFWMNNWFDVTSISTIYYLQFFFYTVILYLKYMRNLIRRYFPMSDWLGKLPSAHNRNMVISIQISPTPC